MLHRIDLGEHGVMYTGDAGLEEFNKAILKQINTPMINIKTEQKELPAHVQRIIHEQYDLTVKIEKLEAFFDTETFETLEEEMQELMREQVTVMKSYNEILTKRLELLTKN